MTDALPHPTQEQAGAYPQFVNLELADLVVDSKYQREVLSSGEKRVKKIRGNFRWSKFGSITVAKRNDNKYAVIDGQHRVLAAANIPWIETVPCAVVEAPDKESQALAFVSVNRDRAAVTGPGLHHALLAAGDESAINIQRICDASSVMISRGATSKLPARTTGAINCLHTCLKVFGEASLTRALDAIVLAHPETSGVLGNDMITALSGMFHQYKNQIDNNRLIPLLSELDITELRKNVAVYRGIKKNVKARDVLVEVMHDLYNKGQHKKLKAPALIVIPKEETEAELKTKAVTQALVEETHEPIDPMQEYHNKYPKGVPVVPAAGTAKEGSINDVIHFLRTRDYTVTDIASGDGQKVWQVDRTALNKSEMLVLANKKRKLLGKRPFVFAH